MIADKLPVYASALIGKVVFVSHGLGVFVRLLSNPIIFGAVIIIPLLIIIFTSIRGMAKDVKQLVAQEEEEEKKKAEESEQAEEATPEEPGEGDPDGEE